MTTLANCDAFLRRWRLALRDRPTVERSFWEGGQAFAELDRTGYLSRVRLERIDKDPLEERLAESFVPAIRSQLNAYRQSFGRVRSLREAQTDHGEWLRKYAAEFRSRAKRVKATDSELSRDLRLLAKTIDAARRGISIRIKERWHAPVPSFFVAPFRIPKKVYQERQLDTWFQLRLASIMRAYMHKNPFPRDRDTRGPSLRTIARLVVLFLVCSDVGVEMDGEVILRHNNRKITVGGVLQQLRSAGFDREDEQ